MSNIGDKIQTNDLGKVLTSLKNNIMYAINVADIYKVVESKDDTYICESIKDEMKIEAYCLDELEIADDDLVVVLYMNYDFRKILANLRGSDNTTDMLESTNLHDKSYGIIIGKMRKE